MMKTCSICGIQWAGNHNCTTNSGGTFTPVAYLDLPPDEDAPDPRESKG